MALLDAHGNPIAAPNPGPAPAAAAQLIDVNQLKTGLGNPKADIPIFYGDASLDNVSAKFLLERIRIYHLFQHQDANCRQCLGLLKSGT